MSALRLQDAGGERMTDREKAIVMAYTGICMLAGDKFQIFHKYVEDIMGRPIWTHEMGLFTDEIKEKSKADFMALCADESSSEKPSKWIPVSERLPNFAGVYLVTRYFPNNVMNPTYLVDACFFDGTDTWHNDNRINHDRKYLTNVVAWLEEPEPYKASPTGAEGSEE